jgi:hypothetical protein
MYATVGGGRNNDAQADYATIAGGGPTDPDSNPTTTNNVVYDDYGTIGGGGRNVVGIDDGEPTWQIYATVGGGRDSTASASCATVGGGNGNIASAWDTTVSGGYYNTASGVGAAIAGGAGNVSGGSYSNVGGGTENTASGSRSTVSGGRYNDVQADYATIAGGGPTDLGNPTTTNNVVTDQYGTIGGGGGNQVGDDGDTPTDAWYATVAGGRENIASASGAAVGGGYVNTASAWDSTVSGGQGNTASGIQAMVPGGFSNSASGDYSFAAGRSASATHNYSFVWSDNSGAGTSANTNTFNIWASNGVYLNGALHAASDRNKKENFEPVDSRDVLAKVAALPMSTWNYKTEDGGYRHMGPMGQDFRAAFALGSDDKHITTVDADGVALAAIQGLNQRMNEIVQEKDAEIRALRQDNASLGARLAALEEAISKE